MSNEANSELHQADVLFARAVLKATRYNDDCQPLFRECIDIRKRVLGDHQDTAMAMLYLAKSMFRNEDQDEASAMLAEAQRILTAALGAEAVELALVIEAQADVLRRREHLSDEDYDRSRALQEEAAKIATREHKQAHEYYRAVRQKNLADAVATVEAEFGPDHLETADALLATMALGSFGDDEEELFRKSKCYKRVIAIYTAHLGADDQRLAAFFSSHGRIYHQLGDFWSAVNAYLEALRVTEINHGPVSMKTALAMVDLRNMWRKDTRPMQLMNGLLVRNCPIKEEIAAAAKWWHDQLLQKPVHDIGDDDLNVLTNALQSDPAPAFTFQLNLFREVLEREMAVSIAYGTLRTGVDYHPDKMLHEALKASGIDDGMGTLPFKSGTSIEVGKVSAHGGYTDGGDVVFEGTSEGRKPKKRFAECKRLPSETSIASLRGC